MSSGIVHARIAWIAEIGIIATSITLDASNVFAVPFQSSVGLAVGGAIGILISPDIDHDKITLEELRWYRVGRIFGLAWQSFWSVYPILFRHRGWSHTPVLGTLTRIAYIGIQLFILASVIHALSGYDLVQSFKIWLASIPPETREAFGVPMLLAWIIQDTIHFVTDIISTRLKKSPYNHV